ncbi:MAG: amidohydrolase family protein [Bacteroidetes bacterium]|nr:amidohydrolase family protein [Bacteroidota bacterium]
MHKRIHILLFLSGTLFFPLCFLHAQIALKDFALTGVTLIDAGHTKPSANQTVVVKNNMISDIFPDGSKILPDSVVAINLNGKYLIPGLIDTHVHMATDPSDIDNRATTLNVLSKMLYSGITSVRDMAGDARTLASYSRDAMTGDIISPNIYYSALMAGPQFFEDPRVVSSTKGIVTGKAPYMQAISDTTNLVLAVARAKGTGATGIKLYANLSAQLATKIIAEAQRQQIKVWGHGWLQGARPTDLVKAGISSVSHVPLLIYENFDSIPVSWRSKHDDKFWDDSVHIHSDLYKLMKANNTILDATLLTYKRAAKNENSRWYYQYQIGKRLIRDAYKAGVKICTGTDDDQEEFVQYEMQLLTEEAGFSNMDALIAATKTAAEAIGIENTRGTIEPNKIADLVVLDKNPLAKIENIRTVFLVIKNGEIFKADK